MTLAPRPPKRSWSSRWQNCPLSAIRGKNSHPAALRGLIGVRTQFLPRQVPIQPVPQLGIEFRRRLAGRSITSSEAFNSRFNLDVACRSSFQLANERQELSQLFFGKFRIEQRLLPI